MVGRNEMGWRECSDGGVGSQVVSKGYLKRGRGFR